MVNLDHLSLVKEATVAIGLVDYGSGIDVTDVLRGTNTFGTMSVTRIVDVDPGNTFISIEVIADDGTVCGIAPCQLTIQVYPQITPEN